MAEFRVPAILEVRGVMIVEAESKAEALKLAEDGDYADMEVNIPIDIIDGEADVLDETEIETEDDGEDNEDQED